MIVIYFLAAIGAVTLVLFVILIVACLIPDERDDGIICAMTSERCLWPDENCNHCSVLKNLQETETDEGTERKGGAP